MEKNIMSFDWAIKEILRDKANFDVLSGFLTELLEKDVKVLELIESESNKEDEKDKYNRLDLCAKIDNNEVAIFEFQTSRENDFFHRILYGTSRAVTQQLTEGKKYGDIKKVYSIDVVYFNLGKGTDYVYHGTTTFKGIHNNETLLLSENEMKFLPKHLQDGEQSAGKLFPEYYILYPEKFDENIKNKFDEWIYTLKTSVVKSNFSAAGIQAAGKKLDKAKMTKAERERYEHYLKFERVKDSEIESAKDEGKIEGKLEEKIEIAQNLKKMGLSTTQIAQATGLTEAEIKAL